MRVQVARAAAHRVDQHVGGLEMRGRFGVTRLPALEAGERVRPCRWSVRSRSTAASARGAVCLTSAAAAAVASLRLRDGCTRGGSPGCFLYCGGHGASPWPSRSWRCGELEQAARASRDDRRSRRGDRRPRRSAPASSRSVKSAGSQSSISLPVERRRHPRVGLRPHRVGGGDGAVLRVLVVVDEDAVALLLPPLAGGDARARAARPRAPAPARRAAPGRTSSAARCAR